MIDIKIFGKVLKSSWVKKYLDPENQGKFVRTACQSVRHYPFYTSVRTAKQTVRKANQTVQIIYSPVRMVCPSVRNFYSSVRTADQTVQIIYSPIRTVRQTVRTLQGPFVNRSSSVRFCRSNGFPLVSVLPFTVTFVLEKLKETGQ